MSPTEDSPMSNDALINIDMDPEAKGWDPLCRIATFQLGGNVAGNQLVRPFQTHFTHLSIRPPGANHSFLHQPLRLLP